MSRTVSFTKNGDHTSYNAHATWSFSGSLPSLVSSNIKAKITIVMDIGDIRLGGTDTSGLYVFAGREGDDSYRIGTVPYQNGKEMQYTFVSNDFTGDALQKFINEKAIHFSPQDEQSDHCVGAKAPSGRTLQFSWTMIKITPVCGTVESVVGSETTVMSGDLIHGCSYKFNCSCDNDGSTTPTQVRFYYKSSDDSEWTSKSVTPTTDNKYSFYLDTGLVGADTSTKVDWKFGISVNSVSAEASGASRTLLNTSLSSPETYGYGASPTVSWSLTTSSISNLAKAWGGKPKIVLQARGNGENYSDVFYWNYSTAGTPHCTASQRQATLPFSQIGKGHKYIFWRIKVGSSYYTEEKQIQQIAQTPTSPSASTTLIHGAVYKLKWTLPTGFDSKNAKQKVSYQINSGTWQSAVVSGTEFTLPAMARSTNSFKWKVGFDDESTVESSAVTHTVSDPTGKTSASGSVSNPHVALNLTNSFPNSGNSALYKGLKVTFNWGNLTTTKPSESYSFNPSLDGGTLYCYNNNDRTNIITLGTFTGSTKQKQISNSLSEGTYSWYVAFKVTESDTVFYSGTETFTIDSVSVSNLGNLKRGYKVNVPIPAFGNASSAQNPTMSGYKVEIANASSGSNLFTPVTVKTSGKTATTYIWDTVKDGLVPSVESIKYRVTYLTDIGNHTTAWSDLSSVSAPTVTFSNMYPTTDSSVYIGINEEFRFTTVVDTSPLCILQAASAKLEFKTSAATTWTETGSGFTVVNNTGTLLYAISADHSEGGYKWRAKVKLNTGDEVYTDETGFTLSAITVILENLKPATGTIAPRMEDIQFSWSFSPDIDDSSVTSSDVKQTGAVLKWRKNSGDNWRTIQEITGAENAHTVEHGYFVDFAVDTIQWMVTATSKTGQTVSSDVQTVTIKDAFSNAVALKPSGTFEDDTINGVNFKWSHIISTGTEPTGFTIQYKKNTASSWTNLTDKSNTDATEFTANAGVFENSGTYQWRVKTKNSEGLSGTGDEYWSESAVFAIRKKPSPPVIRSVDPKPICTVKWNSEEQVTCKIELDGVEQDTVYSYDKSWTSRDLLDDGYHIVRIKIINAFGDESDWAEAEFTVQNDASGTISISSIERVGEVQFTWAFDTGTFVKAYLLRDDEVIAASSVDSGESSFTDKLSVGSHRYKIRAFDSEGYYTDSNAVYAMPKVKTAVIGLLDGTKWIDLEWKTSNYTKSVGSNSSLVQFYGWDRPVYKQTESQTMVHSITGAKIGYESTREVEHLQGHTVIYKDSDNHIAVGVITDVSIVAVGLNLHKFSFSVTETHQEGLEYEKV